MAQTWAAQIRNAKREGKALLAEHMRELIDIEEQFHAIGLQIARLEASGVFTQVWDAELQEYRMEASPPVDVPAVKAALDARFKLLNKVLPDLKQQEIIQHIDGQLDTGEAVDMTDDELLSRMMFYLNRPALEAEEAPEAPEIEQEAEEEGIDFT